MRGWFRQAGWRGRVCLVLLFALAGCAGPVAGLYPPQSAETCRTIRLVGHGWHTGIVVAATDVSRPIAAWFPNARYLEFGWGDRAFYMAREQSAWLALRAVLLPTDSVMHVAGYAEPPRAGWRSSRSASAHAVSRS